MPGVNMALKDILKVNRKTFFDPSGWLGYGLLKSQSRYLYDTLKQVITPPKPTHSETFEEAMKRLHISMTDVASLEKTYTMYSYVFFGLAIVAVLSSIYLLFAYSTLAGFILGIGVTALFLTQSFRYNFWAFQIKHRKLGCTFEEWKTGKINKTEEPKE